MTSRPQSDQVPGRASDESTPAQLELARSQGDAYGKAVEMMTREEAHGEERRVGDYLVGYAVEEAEGMYQLRDGELEWQTPTDENAHIEVIVRDAEDGRFIPGLQVRVTVSSDDGDFVGDHVQPFLWHPWLHHYGRNWKLPGDGRYTIDVHVAPATFMRHDKVNGQRFTRALDVSFEGVEIETGRK